MRHIDHNVRQLRHFDHREFRHECEQTEQQLQAAEALICTLVAGIHQIRRNIDQNLPSIHNFSQIHHELCPRFNTLQILAQIARGVIQNRIQVTNDHLGIIRAQGADLHDLFRNIFIAF